MTNEGKHAEPVIGVDVTYLSLLTVVVTVSGILDMDTVTHLRMMLMAIIDAQPPRTLTIDIAGVELLDAASMAALVQVHQYAREQRITIGLVNGLPLVARMIEVGGLTRFFTLTPNS